MIATGDQEQDDHVLDFMSWPILTLAWLHHINWLSPVVSWFPKTRKPRFCYY